MLVVCIELKNNVNNILMKVNQLTEEQYETILEKMNKMETSIENAVKRPGDRILDNQELIKLLRISKRTAQNWRDEGKISFSQIGSKIYYKMADIQKLLDTNYRKAFNKQKEKFKL